MVKVWMKISNDEFELPLAVADTASELAKICGTTDNVVRSSACHVRSGRKKFTSYICVEIKEGDDE